MQVMEEGNAMALKMARPVNVKNVVHAIKGEASVGSLMSRVICGVLATLTLAGVCTASSAPGAASASEQAHVGTDYGKVPLSFEANHGQTDPRVQFFSRGQGYGLFLTPNEAVLELEKLPAGAKKVTLGKGGKSAAQPAPETSVLRMKLVGGDAAAPVAAQDLLPGTVNYFRGNNPRKWATDVPTYKRVSYTGVYSGIDLVYYGNQRQLEYDFVVAPGADPKQIALSFSGATPKIDSQGDLVLADKKIQTSFHKPVVYQMAGDTRVSVESGYQLQGKQVHFALGNYDHSKPLVIDPVLTYGTFLGGTLDDRGFAIAVDDAGNAYIAGDTVSTNFPLVDAYQSTNHDTSNGWVVFVSKLNPAGTALIYSTFLGGVADSHALGLDIDSTGSAYVAGYTSAGDFPVTAGAFQTLCGGNYSAASGTRVRVNGCAVSADTSGFLTKLSPAGNSLEYSTFLGGSGFSQITGVAVDAAGEAYVTGDTNSQCGAGPYWPVNPSGANTYQCFPTTSGAYQTTLNGQVIPAGNGSTWAFLTKFSADGSTLLYSTDFLAPQSTGNGGNPLTASAYGVAVDDLGNAYIAGNAGYGLPTTPNAYYVPPANSSTVIPPYPAFVAKFNPTLSGSASLVFSTFLGSAAQTAIASGYTNVATGVVVDASGGAIVTGYTNVAGYPTTTDAYQTATSCTSGCGIGFVTKLSTDGTALAWSTLLGQQPGASNSVQLTGIAQGATGNIYVTGTVNGFGDYPVVNPITHGVNGGAVISELDSTGTSLLFSSYISGYGSTDYATGVAADVNGNIYVTGRVDGSTPTIPTTKGALQTTYQGGSYDAFVIKIAPLAASTTALSLSSGSVSAGQSVTFTAIVSGPAGSSVPTGTVTFYIGSTPLGTGKLDGTGKATYSTSTLSATTYTVTAQYSGDTSYSGSSSTSTTLVVNPIATSTALTVTPATAVSGTSVLLSAKITPASGTAIPTGTVTFSNGSTQIAAVAVDGTGKATFTSATLAVGTYTIIAAYSGDSINASSTSTAANLTITAPLVSTTTTLSASPSSAAAGASIALTAAVAQASGSVVPTGTVTFKEGSTTLGTGTLAAGKATFTTSALAEGTHSITASYGGDAVNAASTSSAITVTIAAAPAKDFTISLTPKSATATPGATEKATVTVTPVNGFNSATSLACTGLPSYSTCSFNPASVTPNGTAASTSTLTIATNVKAAAAALHLASGESQHPAVPNNRTIAVAGILASFLLLPLAGWKNRKVTKLLVIGIAVLALTGAIGGMTGCGGESNATTPSGTYAVTVTGTSGSLTHSATYTITVQ
jgi:hypothetical protein